jgi:hypothetical protein
VTRTGWTALLPASWTVDAILVHRYYVDGSDVARGCGGHTPYVAAVDPNFAIVHCSTCEAFFPPTQFRAEPAPVSA